MRALATVTALLALAAPLGVRAQEPEGGQGGQLPEGETPAAAEEADRHDALMIGYAYSSYPDGFPVEARMTTTDTGIYAREPGGPGLAGLDLRWTIVRRSLFFSSFGLQYLSDSTARVAGSSGLTALTFSMAMGIGYMLDERTTRMPGVAVGGAVSAGIVGITAYRYTDVTGAAKTSIDEILPIRALVLLRASRFAAEVGISKDVHLTQIMDMGSTAYPVSFTVSAGVAF